MKSIMKSVIYARVSPTKHIKTMNDMHQSIEESLKEMMEGDVENGNKKPIE